MDQDKLALYYFQVTDVWKRHCELHSRLFDCTCDEYACLLDSDLEKLEQKVKEKEEVIQEISRNDNLRVELLDKIASDDTKAEIKSISDLLTYFSNFEAEKNNKHLKRFNLLLIDIIEKIQDQNKKNQVFLNKAISSLREIRESATGTTTVSTYNAKGVQKNRTLAKEAR